MRIKIASTTGFCWGVKRAFDKVLGTLVNTDTVQTIGPLVHNEKAIQMLERRGLRTCNTVSEINTGTVVIRAHGISPDVEEELRAKNITIVEATCPHVLKIQQKVAEGRESGMHVCIVGYRDHPEVEALAARAGESRSVIASEEEVDTLPIGTPVLLVAQSTFNGESFKKIREKVEKRCTDVTVFDSVCTATSKRQDEVRSLAQECDAVVVVGSHQSSNTKRLVEIAEKEGKPTYHATCAEDLDIEQLSQFTSIGVTSGASTPNWVTRRVVETLADLDSRDPGRISVLLRRFLQGCVESGLYASCGAAVLTAAACLMQGIEPKWSYLTAAFCYIFSVYTLNRLRRSDEQLPPTRRMDFLRKHLRIMLSASVILAVTALIISIRMGVLPAALVATSYLLGFAYGVRVLPATSSFRYKRLQDIPASKDVFEAGAWTMICCVVPFTHADGPSFGLPVLTVCLFVFSTVFAKATMYDSLDIQGDRVLGRETIPALLGERRTWRLLWILTVCACMAILLLSLTTSGAKALPLLAGPLYAALYLPILRKGLINSENLNTVIVDGELFLLGLIAYMAI